MAVFTGQPGIINRMLGFLDSDDSTNTPIGLASLARNCAFDQTSVRTRDGFNLTMTGINKAPITGLMGMVYTPETDTESFFELPIIFDLKGALQFEAPVGSGTMLPVPQGLFTPPAGAHMISTQPYNKGWLAFSNLSVPSSQMACFDPKTKDLDPFGMKQYGWTWLASTQVLAGEVATPTLPGGTGHTYRCIVPGTTGSQEPLWPPAYGGTVGDGSVTWQEYTAVMANRLPNPATPTIARQTTGGTFGAGFDVYIILTYQNGMGESLTSTPTALIDTGATDCLLVAIATPPGWVAGLPGPYAITHVRIYTAVVTTGANPPPETSYQFYANGSVGATSVVAAAGSGAYPPTVNTARITPGQLPTPDVAPIIQRISSGGTFPVGRDVYLLQTYLNASGETPAGPANVIVNTELNDGIGATVAAVASYPQITQVNLYECDVATGLPAPNSAQFSLVGTYAISATPTITASATGGPPPIVNSTGPGGNIAADNATGGINGGQGYRYLAIMYMNRNESVSGFTPASVQQYVVDEDGWELSVFNVSPGPSNIIARICAFTVADGTQDGDFWWNGNVNTQYPTANFVYPQTILDDGITMSATVFYDNFTTSGTFNFTDEYLDDDNNVTDRLDIMWPDPCVHIAYLPSVDRMCQTGLYGNWSGCRMSLAAAPEDYYEDTSDVTIESADGERAWGTFEYRSTIYLIRERSGFTLSASPTNPDEWTARRKWSKVGACGPRAFDSCDDFFIFVHRSGIYRFEDTNPDLMTKEIPYWWQEVNWAAANTVCVKIDRETHNVQILVPTGNSMVPDQKVLLNYGEGWQNPIHYSTYSTREIAMDAARKYSIDDMSAFVCDRIERTLPAPPTNVMGDDGIPLTPSSFYQTQFVFGSSGPDGTVQAITPGVFNDNGAGIDWQYETVAPQATMALSKIEGFTLNARGDGKLYPRLLAGRQMITGQDESGNNQWGSFLELPPIDVSVDQSEGLSMAVQGRYNEKWRIGFSNGKVPDAWFMLKWAAIYSIPMFSARSGNPTK